AVGHRGQGQRVAAGEVGGGVGAAPGVDPGHRVRQRRVRGTRREVGAVDPAGELGGVRRGALDLVEQVGVRIGGRVEDQQHLGDGAADDGGEIDLHVVPLVRV